MGNGARTLRSDMGGKGTIKRNGKMREGRVRYRGMARGEKEGDIGRNERELKWNWWERGPDWKEELNVAGKQKEAGEEEGGMRKEYYFMQLSQKSASCSRDKV